MAAVVELQGSLGVGSKWLQQVGSGSSEGGGSCFSPMFSSSFCLAAATTHHGRKDPEQVWGGLGPRLCVWVPASPELVCSCQGRSGAGAGWAGAVCLGPRQSPWGQRQLEGAAATWAA